MKFTEAQLESAIIELLEAEGYPHVLGEAIMRLVSDGNHLKRERTPTPSPSPKGRWESETEGSSPPGRSGDEGRSRGALDIQLIDYSELVAFREPNPGELPSIVTDGETSFESGRNLLMILDHQKPTSSETRASEAEHLTEKALA